MQVYDKQYINGQWRVGSGETVLENHNPYTGDLLYTYQSASQADVADAFAAAEEAAKTWSQVGPGERVVWLEKLLASVDKLADETKSVLIEEGGSTAAKVGFETGTIRLIIKEAMGMPTAMTGTIAPSDIPGKHNLIVREAKGVITVIAPWNVPFVLAMRSIMPAVATGNTVVFKPASDTPASGLLIAKYFDEAGFPPGVVNVICGKGSEIGDSLLVDPRSSLISFTGSTEVGRHVGAVAGEHLKDVSLELGGNNAMVVLADADIEEAAKAANFGKHFNSGQVCMALNRIIVLDEVYDDFVEAYLKIVSQVKVGDPADPEVFVGPIISQSQVKKVMGLVEATKASGAHVLLEGSLEGNLMSPWVFGECTNETPAAKEEVFGPVTSILRAKNEEEAIALAKDTEYGLSGSVFTKDRFHGVQVARQLDSGMIHVNDQSINDEPHVVFGGEKASGIGRFNGKWVMEKFTRERWISVQDEYRSF